MLSGTSCPASTKAFFSASMLGAKMVERLSLTQRTDRAAGGSTAVTASAADVMEVKMNAAAANAAWQQHLLRIHEGEQRTVSLPALRRR